MSRDYIDDPKEDAAWSLRRIDTGQDQTNDLLEEIRDALVRIAVALEAKPNPPNAELPPADPALLR